MLTVAQLAERLDGVWHGDANHAIFSLASLSRASAQDLAYYDNPIFAQTLSNTAAGAVLLKAEHHGTYSGNVIIVSNPLQAMTQAAQYLSQPQSRTVAIAASAQIHPTAQLGKDVIVGDYSVIGAGVQLAEGVMIGAHTVIEANVRIGKYSQIAHNSVVHAGAQIGAHVVINSGTVVGASPFNYVKRQGCWSQDLVVGGVILADKVHLGANTVIDRGTLGDTYLAEGVCVDNLVQIAHDVLIGKNTVIAGCAAIGAYTQIGADCIIGGASSIAAYVHLAADIVITGMSTVNKSLAKSGIYSSGTLVHEHARWRRNAARFRRLDDYVMRLGALEKKVTT
ncbi:UDP-3-O-(3-hydroxymyristoyl)glucosamine N-acyltransferase [Legionella saoudiensis]|uniref:UDP-3-O-(3-hydroxymyristoyl)glucosamine N-acyltransferase n=1 Tax=Legionella saoudiensis TaxID=1750561 RepID=UPI000730B798|nr:UDP-3-O-(3-hydroxymyristoyl)glucosamine N-acyltransferase [Legionella saoudiensis]